MKARIVRRFFSVLVLLVMAFNGLTVFAAGDGEGDFAAGNQYIQYTVNKDNGRFAIRTVEGAVNRGEDSDAPLLYEDAVPDTSFTTFNIDGKAYIFGNNYGFLGLGENFISPPSGNGLVNRAVWSVDGVEITQKIEIVEDLQAANAGNVKISYEVENNSGKSVQIGSRMLFDTMVGTNDAAPILLPNSSGYISKETTLSGSSVPLFWKAVDDAAAPKVVSYGMLSGWSNLAPDEITFAHWQSLSSTKWGYSPNTNLDFTTKDNGYKEADGAVALTWTPSELKDKEKKVYETYYGVGDISPETGSANFTAASYGPQKLAVNDSGSGYNGNPFPVGIQIDNTLTNSQALTNVKATLELSYGLKLVSGETAEKTVASIGINEVKNIDFNIMALDCYKANLPYYKITLTADNLQEPIVKKGAILVPSLKGTPPVVSFTGFAPDTLYNQDNDKSITIAGTGYTGAGFSDDENTGSSPLSFEKFSLINQTTGEKTDIPKKYITIRDDSISMKLPNELTAACKLGTYTVQVAYTYEGMEKTHVFPKTLVMSDKVQYQVRKYQVLQVLRQKNTDGDYVYSIAESASEKITTPANADVLLEIRGRIQELGGVYTVPDGVAMINSFIKYVYNPNETLYTPSPLTIAKKARDIFHDNSYVSISGAGLLYMGDFPFSIGGFAIDLEDKTMYTVEPEKDGEDEAERVVLAPTFLGFKIPGIDGLPITVKNAVIGKDFVSFGGAFDISAFLGSLTGFFDKKNEPKKGNTGTGGTGTGGSGGTGGTGGSGSGGTGTEDEKAEGHIDPAFAVTVDEVRFGVDAAKPGVLILKGVKAGGKVGIPKEFTSKLIPGLDIGAAVEVSYNTFDNNCLYFSGEVDFFVIYASAVIQLKTQDFGGFSLFVPDTCVLSGGFEPGIPIIPVMPVAYITKLGGGFENLYDTLAGNFVTLPPLTLKAIGGLSIAKIFSADTISLAVSLRSLTATAESMKIMKLDILKKVSIGWNFKDTDFTKAIQFEASLSAEINILDFIKGDGCIYIKVDSTKNGPLGPASLGGYVNGSLLIPKAIPFIGGIKLLSASAGVSDENIYAKTSIIGIPVGIKYTWGSDYPVFADVVNLASASNKIDPGYLALNKANTQTAGGKIIYGDNMTEMAFTSRKVLASGQKLLASAAYDPVASGESLYQYSFNVAQGQEYALMEASYTGDTVPELTLTEPDGTRVELVEGTNYMVQKIAAADSASGEEENRVYISLTAPKAGAWTLTSKQELGFGVKDVAPIPVQDSLTAAMTSDKVEAEWDGTNLTGSSISFYLCKDNDKDPGTMLASGVDATSKSAILAVPDGVNTGDYYLRSQVEGNGKTYSNLYSADKLHVVDPEQPAVPAGLKTEATGDGTLLVDWDMDEAAENQPDGYYLEVLEKTTNGEGKTEFKSQGLIDVKDGATSSLIGGKYAANANPGESGGTEQGIIPGHSYTVKVSAYRTVDNILHTAPPVESEEVTVPNPDPPEISLAATVAQGALVEKTDAKGLTYYTTSQTAIQLAFHSNQEVQTTLRVNDTELSPATGQSWVKPIELTEGENNILVYSANDAGDTVVTGIKVTRDTNAPELKIDSPQNGEAVTGSAIQVRGFAEVNSTVTVNGSPVTLGNDGIFEAAVAMDSDLFKEITVIARDDAMNQTVFKTTVMNNSIEKIDKVVLKEEKSSMQVEEEQELSLWAVDEKGSEVRLNPEMVTWELLEGQQCSELSDTGTLTATSRGRAVVRAAFAVDDSFEFEDAAIIDIDKTGSAVESLHIAPSSLSMNIGEQKQLEASVTHTDSSTSVLDPGEVKWQVTSNSNSCISLSTTGLVTARTAGEAVVSAAYTLDGVTYKDTVVITVTGTGSVSAADKQILDTLRQIRTYEEDKGKTGFISAVLQASIDAATGNVTAAVTDAAMANLLSRVKAVEQSGKKAMLEIQVEAPAGSKAVEVEIPRNSFNQLANDTNAGIRVNAGIVTVTFDAAAVDSMRDAAGSGNIAIRIDKVDASALSGELQKELDGRPVYDFTVTAGGTPITDFGKGSARVSIPYTPKKGETSEAIVVYYLSPDGTLKTVQGRYDAAMGAVTFVTDHFSRYAVGYNEVLFTDVKGNDWYKKAVDFIAARGITTGSGNGLYNPDARITRGQFLAMVMKAYGLEADKNPASNFVDAGNTYYTGYLAAARRLGITSGTGGNLFAPEKKITRQEMFALLYNLLKAIGQLPVGGTAEDPLSDFPDSAKVSNWAKDAMKLFAGAGIIGGSGGRLLPSGTASRAEMAQVLYLLLTN